MRQALLEATRGSSPRAVFNDPAPIIPRSTTEILISGVLGPIREDSHLDVSIPHLSLLARAPSRNPDAARRNGLGPVDRPGAVQAVSSRLSPSQLGAPGGILARATSATWGATRSTRISRNCAWQRHRWFTDTQARLAMTISASRLPRRNRRLRQRGVVGVSAARRHAAAKKMFYYDGDASSRLGRPSSTTVTAIAPGRAFCLWATRSKLMSSLLMAATPSRRSDGSPSRGGPARGLPRRSAAAREQVQGFSSSLPRRCRVASGRTTIPDWTRSCKTGTPTALPIEFACQLTGTGPARDAGAAHRQDHRVGRGRDACNQ